MIAYFVYRPTGTEGERGWIFMNQLWARPFQAHLRDRFKDEVRPWLQERLAGGVQVPHFTSKTRKIPHRWAVNYAGDVWIAPDAEDIAVEFRIRWC